MSEPDYNGEVEKFTSTFTEIFQSDKCSPTLAADILGVIKPNNTAACAEALATSLLDVAKKDPRNIDNLVVSTIGLLPEAGTVAVEDAIDGPTDFASLFKFHLHEFTKDDLHETQLNVPKQTLITPNNPTLAVALFSASALKHGLLANVKSPYMFARQGLQLPDAKRETKRVETVAIGTCLQLTVAGATMMAQWLNDSDGLEAIVSALKKLKEKGAVRHPGGAELLNWTIGISENGFEQEKSAEEAWNLLFPA